jgi:hypothetical protein
MAKFLDIDHSKEEDNAMSKLLLLYNISPTFDLKYIKEKTFSLTFQENNIEFILNDSKNQSQLERLMLNSDEDKSWIYLKFIIDETKYVMNLYVSKIEKNNSKNFLSDNNDKLLINKLTFDKGNLVIDLEGDKRLHYDVLRNECFYVQNISK